MDQLNRIYSIRRFVHPLLAATVVVLTMTACASNPADRPGTNPDSVPSGASTTDTINEGSGPAESTP